MRTYIFQYGRFSAPGLQLQRVWVCMDRVAILAHPFPLWHLWEYNYVYSIYIYISSSSWKCVSVAVASGWLLSQWYAPSCYVLVSHDLHRIGTVTKAMTGIIQHPRHIRHQLFIHAYTSLQEAYMKNFPQYRCHHRFAVKKRSKSQRDKEVPNKQQSYLR